MKSAKKSFSHSGITMYYSDRGKGKIILFLHGWGIRGRTYKKLLPILTKRFRVITPDLPGFGDSDTPSRVWGFMEYAHFLDNFIKAKNLRAVTVMGHSTGGGIALYLASINKQVTKLVPIDAAGIPVEYNRAKLYYYYGKQLFRELLKPRNFTITTYALRDYFLNFSHFFYIFKLTKKITSRELANDHMIFRRIHVPTIILWGSEDKVFTGTLAHRLQNAIKHAKLYFVKGSHDWIVFYPEKIITYMDNF